MGLLDAYLFDVRAQAPGPADDFWYNPVGTLTASGQRVDSDSANRISAWFRGRDLLATAVAMLPLHVYERLPGDQGAERAPQHPLYDVLHVGPNGWQDAFTWRRQVMYHLIDHGNAYSRIVAGPRGFADQLWPIDPAQVTPEQLPSGRVVYRVRQKDGTAIPYTQDEIFHLRAGADDGITGKGILQRARESIGRAQATEDYAGRVFSQGVLHGGVVEVPGSLTDEASRRMQRSFVTTASSWHMPKVLELGSKWVESKLTPEDAQMLASREFTVEEMARWLGLPKMMLEGGDPSHGNAEQFSQNFVTYSLGSWLSLIEHASNFQLILNSQRFYVEFVRDALVRGSIADRWAAYQIAIQTGTYTRNEVRRLENRRGLDGLSQPLDPAFLVGNRKPQDAPQPRRTVPARDDEQAQAMAVESASRLLRKEIKAMTALAVRYANDADGFAVAVTDFYAKHADLVCEALLMPRGDAEAYCAGQASQVLGGGVIVTESWTSKVYASGVVAWAMGGWSQEQSA